MKFEPLSKRTPGQRGEGVLTSLDESARAKMLELFLLIDDGRETGGTMMGWLRDAKQFEEQNGESGVEAIRVIDECLEFFRELYGRVAVVQTILTGVEDYRRRQQNGK